MVDVVTMPRPKKSRKRSQNAAALSASVIKKQKNEKTCGLKNTDNESSIDMSDTSVVSSNNGVGETGRDVNSSGSRGRRGTRQPPSQRRSRRRQQSEVSRNIQRHVSTSDTDEPVQRYP